MLCLVSEYFGVKDPGVRQVLWVSDTIKLVSDTHTLCDTTHMGGVHISGV